MPGIRSLAANFQNYQRPTYSIGLSERFCGTQTLKAELLLFKFAFLRHWSRTIQ
jgi:hypothetical protein